MNMTTEYYIMGKRVTREEMDKALETMHPDHGVVECNECGHHSGFDLYNMGEGVLECPECEAELEIMECVIAVSKIGWAKPVAGSTAA